MPNALKINVKLLFCYSESGSHENSECLATLAVSTGQKLQNLEMPYKLAGHFHLSANITVTSDDT